MAETEMREDVLDLILRTAARTEANAKAINLIAKELDTLAPGSTTRIVRALADIAKAGSGTTKEREEEFSRLVRILTSS